MKNTKMSLSTAMSHANGAVIRFGISRSHALRAALAVRRWVNDRNDYVGGYATADRRFRAANIGHAPEGSIKGTGRKAPWGTVTYWDPIRGNWRAFRLDRLLCTAKVSRDQMNEIIVGCK